MAARRSLRALARRALGGTSPAQVGHRARDAGIEEVAAHAALELALRIGEAMLSLGAAAVDVTAAIQRVVRAFGLVGCQVELTFTSITLSYDRGAPAYPLTMMRLVRDRIPDYGRLAGIFAVARDLGNEPIAREEWAERLEQAHSQIDRIVNAPQAYRRWVVTVALAGLAGGIAILMGGGPAVALVAGLTTAVIDRVTWSLGRWGLPPFFLQAIGAAIVTMVAIGLRLAAPYLPYDLATIPPSLVVASGIVVLLAGLSLVGAAEDAISGFPLTAVARTFEVLVLTLGIVVGIGAVLDLARRSGVGLEVIDIPPSTSPLLVQGAAGAMVAVAWAVASYARPRAILAAAGAGGVAWFVFTAVSELGAGRAVASAVAALVVGFLSESAGARLGVPPIVTSVCGVVPLLPGLAVYRGLFQLVNEPEAGLVAGVGTLLGAAMIGLALAAGVTFGEFVAAPLRLGTRRRRHVPERFRRRTIVELSRRRAEIRRGGRAGEAAGAPQHAHDQPAEPVSYWAAPESGHEEGETSDGTDSWASGGAEDGPWDETTAEDRVWQEVEEQDPYWGSSTADSGLDEPEPVVEPEGAAPDDRHATSGAAPEEERSAVGQEQEPR